MRVDVQESDCADLLVIGGGINGAGIARDASGRGLKVALVEQDDLASGTSSKSTKLIHGGLRYLEYGEFRLVREALSERETLLAIAPHLVQPREFILPHVAGLRPRWMIRFGLFLYDHIGQRRRLPASRAIQIAGTAYGEPLKDGLAHGYSYADCWVDDSRLVVLNALDAAERGARIHTRTRFLSARRAPQFWHAECEETRTGRRFEIRARAIVNAAGPWVEHTLRGFPDVKNKAQARLIKGSHIVVPRMYRGEHAFMLQNPDRRIVFTIPYEDEFTLVGTTDVPFDDDPAAAEISAAEIAYLCNSVRNHFRQPIHESDIRWSYTGVRPLLDDEAANASKITRDYRLEISGESDEPPVLSIFGGKLTTYRRLAETALARLHPTLAGSRQSWTGSAALPGGDLPREDLPAFVEAICKRWPFLQRAQATRLARCYGTRVESIMGSAHRAQDMGEPFGAGFTEAELEYLMRFEWARSADDVLWRRTKLGLHMRADERAAVERFLSKAVKEDRSDAATAAAASAVRSPH